MASSSGYQSYVEPDKAMRSKGDYLADNIILEARVVLNQLRSAAREGQGLEKYHIIAAYCSVRGYHEFVYPTIIPSRKIIFDDEYSEIQPQLENQRILDKKELRFKYMHLLYKWFGLVNRYCYTGLNILPVIEEELVIKALKRKK